MSNIRTGSESETPTGKKTEIVHAAGVMPGGATNHRGKGKVFGDTATLTHLKHNPTTKEPLNNRALNSYMPAQPAHSHKQPPGVDAGLSIPQQLALQPSQRSPINADVLEQKLIEAKYDPQATDYLVSGFRYGFDLGLNKSVAEIFHETQTSNKKCRQKDNHNSVSLKPEVVQKKINEEVQAGRMIGPCQQPPFEHYIVSPLGLVRKKEKDKFRIIHDLSYPRDGVSVNSCIPDSEGTVKYDNVAKAIQLIRKLGKGAVLVKSDIQHAYKLIPLKNSQIPAMGIKWKGKWYFDATLAMGSKSGCAIFERFECSNQNFFF